ncbi:MAG: DUF4349 domain-containing protein [Chloroflexi bacterium]|nr:DUF4349 domain-containing protein [Chloroflexota bacterium]
MNRRWIITIGMFVVLVTLLGSSACRRAAETEPSKGFPGIIPTPTPAPVPAASAPPIAIRPDVDFAASDLGVSQERRIVRNADMSLIVRSVTEARDQVVSLANRMEGFVVSSFIFGEELEMRGSITIRVPDGRFDLTLSELRKLAVRVESESTSSRDVTEEFIDLQARLKNAEATESQLAALLVRAQNVEESLKIYEALSRVRSEIEQIKGRLQFLERTTETSLINIQLRPVGTGSTLIPAGWNFLEALKSAIRGLATFGQWLVTMLIWVVLLSPVWGTLLGIIVWRVRRRRRSQ